MKNYLLFIFVYCFILNGYAQVAEPPLTSPNIEHIIQHPSLGMLGKTVEEYLPDLQKIGLFTTSPNASAVQKGNTFFQIKSSLDFYESIKWNTPIYAITWNYVNTVDPNRFFPDKKEYPEVEMPNNLLFGSTDNEIFNLFGNSHQQSYSDASPIQYKRWIYTIPGDTRTLQKPVEVIFEFMASGDNVFRLYSLSVAFAQPIPNDSIPLTASKEQLSMSEFLIKRAVAQIQESLQKKIYSEAFWTPGENQLRVLEISLQPGALASIYVVTQVGAEKEVKIYSTNNDRPEETRFYENDLLSANDGLQVIKAITRNVSNKERVQQFEIHNNAHVGELYYFLVME